jgi:hypothetical protein
VHKTGCSPFSNGMGIWERNKAAIKRPISRGPGQNDIK